MASENHQLTSYWRLSSVSLNKFINFANRKMSQYSSSDVGKDIIFYSFSAQ